MKRRVAIVGGGIAGLTVAFELTHPDNPKPCEVTVFQQGWRLGGKGASSRPRSGKSGMRIEEHGLHLFMGFYDNAFALMRSCLAEADLVRELEPGKRYKIRDFDDAFERANFIGLMERPEGRDYQLWNHLFGDDGILPGEKVPQDFRVRDYLERGMGLLRQLWNSTATAESMQGFEFTDTPRELRDTVPLARRLLEARDSTETLVLASIAVGTELLDTIKGLIESLPEGLPIPDTLRGLVLTALEGVIAWANQRVQSASAGSGEDLFRRIWEVIEIVAACLRGILIENLNGDASFDRIDHYDFREWLELHGASKTALRCAVLKGLYDLTFEYEEGDPDRPRFSAAAALRGSIRMFLTYHGALFWRMKAGMGEVIFEPLYTVLKARGVKFEFFHELTELHADDAHAVCALVFNRQARLRSGTTYDPLETLQLELGVELNYWPAEPRYELLEGGRDRNQAKQFECAWNRVAGDRVYFNVGGAGADFDHAVLAIGLAAIPSVAQDLIKKSARWADMVSRVKTVETHAMQLWLRDDLLALGWPYDSVALSAYSEPFSTWADMTHLLAVEKWPTPGPRSLAYFCHVVPDADPPPAPDDRDYPHRRLSATRELAWKFLERDIGRLWPHVTKTYPVAFDASKLYAAAQDQSSGPLTEQYVRVNVNPSDRYVLALPGTLQYRLRPGDSGFARLTLAGDWTRNGLNVGCVEAAVLSGRQAAQAITGFPSDEKGWLQL